MARPNFIPGMKLRGIGRSGARQHLKQRIKSWQTFEAKVRKSIKEEIRRKLANRPFEE